MRIIVLVTVLCLLILKSYAQTSQIDFQIKDPTCFGSNDGYIEVLVSSEEFNSILWSNGDTTWRIENLYGGTYTCKIYDKDGGVKEQHFVLKRPNPLSIALKTIHFSDNRMGSIDLHVTGGSGNYSFHWSNSETDSCIYNLYPGDYTVEVFDVNNCSLDATVTIRDLSEMLVSTEYQFD